MEETEKKAVPKPRINMEVNLPTVFMAVAVIGSIFWQWQGNQVELSNHADRIAALEQERIEDRQTQRDQLAAITQQLIAIAQNLVQVQVAVAQKQDMRRR